MPTNLITLKSVDQFTAGFVPVYTPLYGLLMSRAVAYDIDVGEIALRHIETIGDIRAARITPKDTEIKQIAVGEGKKYFKKYFLASQFIISQFQDAQGVDDVTAQVLDEHNRQYDELVFNGEGTTVGTQINNGLYLSSDPNYVVESSVEIASGGNDPRLLSLHAAVMTNADKANRVAGRKAVIFFGSNILPLVNGLYVSGKAFRSSLQEALGGDYTVISLPSDTALNNGQGWMIVNLDQIKFHYTALPQLQKRGVNEEKNYAWSNFLMGSSMVEVLATGGIIRQPSTLAA
jgi:hypothetical protein